VVVAQFVDPAVSKAKFDRQIEEFRDLANVYRQRGWLLLEAEYPDVLAVLAAPQLQPPAIITGVAFDYSNYDAQPPSVRLVNPFTKVPYLGRELPTLLQRSVGAPPVAIPGLPVGAHLMVQQPLMQFHSPDDVPFLCIAGVREYHEHPGHTGDAWELHRASAGKLVRLLEIIHKYGVQPITGYSVNLVPQIGFQSGQVPE
jgi:Predicted metal binding domain